MTIATSMSEIRVYSNLSAVIFSLGYRVGSLIQKYRWFFVTFTVFIGFWNRVDAIVIFWQNMCCERHII